MKRQKSPVRIGYKLHKLTVIGLGEKKRDSSGRLNTFWLCRCDCGNEKFINSSNLRPKSTVTSCGCALIKATTDMIGKRYGNLEILSIAKGELTKNNDYMVNCRCDCGKERSIDARSIRRGNTVSCGCKIWKWQGYGQISIDYWHRIIASAKKRNLEFTITLEEAWNQALKQNKKCVYTGLDLGFSRVRKERTASLDRIDSSKGYIVGNIQWVDRRSNYMKSDMSEKDFLEYIKLLYIHNFGEQ